MYKCTSGSIDKLHLEKNNYTLRSKLALIAAVRWNVGTQPRLEGNLNISIETNGRIKHRVRRKSIVSGAAGTLPLAVDVERQSAAVEVQLNADYTSGSDAALGAVGVTACVHEPATSTIDVHAPTTLVLTCNTSSKLFTVIGN